MSVKTLEKYTCRSRDQTRASVVAEGERERERSADVYT